MEKVILILSMSAATSAIFFPFLNFPKTGQNMMNVCIYATDPTRYQPKCFLCPSAVYGNVLQACLNAAAIPRNITYVQARCLEQNCAINRGKRSVDGHPPGNLLEEFGTLTEGQRNGEIGKMEEWGSLLPTDGEEESAERQQNGEIGKMEELDTADGEEEKGGQKKAAEQDGYKVVGTEEFMASDVQDYLDYSDMVD